jgi:hypothetical protein
MPGLASMKANTAACLPLRGVSLWLMGVAGRSGTSHGIIEILQQGDPISGIQTVLLRSDDTSVSIMLWVASIVVGAGGFSGSVLIMEDATQQKQPEAAPDAVLKSSDSAQAQAFEALGVAAKTRKLTIDNEEPENQSLPHATHYSLPAGVCGVPFSNPRAGPCF